MFTFKEKVLLPKIMQGESGEVVPYSSKFLCFKNFMKMLKLVTKEIFVIKFS